MDPSVFVLQPYVVVATMVSVLVAAIAWLAFRARKKGEQPIITASLKELQKGWYQLSITVINRLPYQLFGVSLRRIRPRSARLMAPIISVSTKQGDFQVWSNPAVDKLTTTIPLDIALGPHEARQAGVLADSQTQTTVWVFLSKKSDARRLIFDLTLSDGEQNLRRCRFAVTRGFQLGIE
ncbi:MAG: hypothetical protein WAL09_19715 [Pseudolabrys sp.]